MDTDIRALLALTAAERLTLAEILVSSVGYPPDIDAATVPEWRYAEMSRRLARFAADNPET